MNVKKSVLSLGLAITMILPSIASINTPVPSNSASKKIHQAISNLDIDYSKYAGTEIQVKFMVNENDELIILSTNESELDMYIKNSLNYQSVKKEELKAYKVYILPVKFAVKA